MQNKLTVLIEPTAACNLRCLHCYHAKSKYDDKIMDLDVLSDFLHKCAPHYEYVYVTWHGGEPLIAGHEFFVEAYKLFEQYGKKYGTKFAFSIQTNGTLLTQEFIDLFVQTNTRINISYDGKFNNVLRQETEKTESVIDRLKSQDIEFHCISTISTASVQDMVEIYEYFNVQKINAKFNPIFPDGAACAHNEFVLSKEEWTENFIQLFDHWLFDEGCNIKFNSCIHLLDQYFEESTGCLTKTCLFKYLVIDAYGNLYPCGRTICDELLLGNISEITDIRQVFLSSVYKNILDCNSERGKKCSRCKWFSKCHSGCNASAYINGDMSKVNEFDCYFTRHVFEHIEKMLDNINENWDKLNPKAKKILERKIVRK